MANPKNHYPRKWRDGAGAFGKLYGDSIAMVTSERTARFLTGVALREDPRYVPSNSKNPLVRTMHALAFTFIDKTDSGRNTIAFSNFAGAAAGGFVGRAYLPHGYNDLTHAEQRMAIQFKQQRSSSNRSLPATWATNDGGWRRMSSEKKSEDEGCLRFRGLS